VIRFDIVGDLCGAQCVDLRIEINDFVGVVVVEDGVFLESGWFWLRVEVV
jgi:hypothetical protein